MGGQSRKDRLRALLSSELSQLPDRPGTSPSTTPSSVSGGVDLDQPQPESSSQALPNSPHQLPNTIAAFDGNCETAIISPLVTPSLLSEKLHLPTGPIVVVDNSTTEQPRDSTSCQSSGTSAIPSQAAALPPDVPPTTQTGTQAPIEDLVNNFDDPVEEDLPPKIPRESRVPDCYLARGQLAPRDQTFCPIDLFSKFPYKFVGRYHSERIADGFFNAGKFWERTWDLYYVWAPLKDRPLILISELQAQILIKEINDFFDDIQVEITSEHKNELGLVVKFLEPHSQFRPRYLGRSSTREEFQAMEKNAPSKSFRRKGEPEEDPPSDEAVETFKAWYEQELGKSKDKAKVRKAQKREEKLIIQRGFVKQLKRTQRYLGLRPKKPVEPLRDPEQSHLPWAELQAAQQKWQIVNTIPPLDVNKASPYPFEESVIFIAIDVEAYERDARVITEIGVSTLDTRDLAHLPPGKDAAAWREKIRTRHFWIKEHMYIRNHEFVNGCPDRFEFGESEMVTLDEARNLVAACFRPPYGAANSMDQASLEVQLANLGIDRGQEERQVVLVGHDPDQDIKYLNSIGANPLNSRSTILEKIDTAILYKTWKREPQAPSLGSILYDFHIVGWNLHNAGNDAHYTMEALLAIVVREASLNGTKALQLQREAEKAHKVEEATQKAIADVEEKAEGWTSAEGEDGGEPIKPDTDVVPVIGKDGTTYYRKKVDMTSGRGSRRGSIPRGRHSSFSNNHNHNNGGIGGVGAYTGLSHSHEQPGSLNGSATNGSNKSGISGNGYTPYQW